MSTRHARSLHLSDEELLHWIDGEGDGEQRERWRAHIAACPRCAAEVDSLARYAQRVSAELARIGVPSDFAYPDESTRSGPGRKRTRPRHRRSFGGAWLRAAAVVMLLLSPFLLIEPLRAGIAEWLGDQWRELQALAGSGPAPAPEPPAPVAAPPISTLWFRTAGDEFRVELMNRQTSGTLTIRRTEGASGYFTAPIELSREHPLIAEGTLRIHNSVGSAASYEIGLPPTVERVTVRMGSSAVHRIQLETATDVRLDLATPAPGQR